MAARAYSIEDGNLESKSVVVSRNRVYRDIDLLFGDTPSGDVFKKTDASAVKQSVKNLLMTNLTEKPFRPRFGADLNKFLFELSDFFDKELIEDNVRFAIENFEPRARVLNVNAQVFPDFHDVKVTVKFQVISTQEVIDLDLSLARLR